MLAIAIEGRGSTRRPTLHSKSSYPALHGFRLLRAQLSHRLSPASLRLTDDIGQHSKPLSIIMTKTRSRQYSPWLCGSLAAELQIFSGRKDMVYAAEDLA